MQQMQKVKELEKNLTKMQKILKRAEKEWDDLWDSQKDAFLKISLRNFYLLRFTLDKMVYSRQLTDEKKINHFEKKLKDCIMRIAYLEEKFVKENISATT